MTPLERHIAGRDLRQASKRSRILNALRPLPSPVSRLLAKRIWPVSLRHMRAIADGCWFGMDADQRWSLNFGGKFIARSVPLRQLMGTMDRPVTIVASGPSAAEFPWETLRNGERWIVAVNGACEFLRRLGITADLLMVTDAQFPVSGHLLLRNVPDLPMVTTCAASSVLAMLSPGDLSRRKFAIIERVNAWYGVPALESGKLADLNARSGSPLHLPERDPRKFKVGWSDDPEIGVFSGCTVPFAALQLLIGLGAVDIEIIGMDLDGSGRSYVEGADAPPSLLEIQYEDFILPSFEIMRHALARSGVRIRNHSPVCPLPPRIFGG